METKFVAICFLDAGSKISFSIMVDGTIGVSYQVVNLLRV